MRSVLVLALLLTGCGRIGFDPGAIGGDDVMAGDAGLDDGRIDGAGDGGVIDPPPAVGSVLAATGGRHHTCAVRSDHSLWCWGSNNNYELGVGVIGDPRTTPTEVTAIGSVRAVASAGAGTNSVVHTCAIGDDDALRCWGRNGFGQLGTGAMTIYAGPAIVTSLGAVTAMAVGVGVTCAIKADTSLWCWGHNDVGQLGDGTLIDRASPVPVLGLESGVAQVATNISHTCALKLDGTLWCWGQNGSGQLGDGTATSRSIPAQVTSLGAQVAQVAVSQDSSYAVLTDGTAWSWGRGIFGALGDGTAMNRRTPVQISSLTSVIQLGAQAYSACAVTSDGGLWCWGENEWGQLGVQGVVDLLVPARVTSVPPVSAVTVGYQHTCAITAAGPLACWGHRYLAALGDGEPEVEQYAPAQVTSFPDVAQVDLGTATGCGLATTGELRCWGEGGLGSLLAPGLYDVPTSTGTSAPGGRLVSGSSHGCVIQSDQTLWCWGVNAAGQLGDGTTTTSFAPIEVTTLGATVVEVDVNVGQTGHYHTCARRADGTAWCWGGNLAGQVGDGTTINRSTPLQVAGLSGVTAIAVGDRRSCAIDGAGALWCWGAGQTSPAQITTMGPAMPFVSVAPGASHTCAMKLDGTVWCWGENTIGQLGDGSTTARANPVAVSSLGAEARALESGASHTCAIKLDDTLWCWGGGNSGQLGHGARGNRSVATQVTGLTAVAGLAAGYATTCAVRTDGSVWCFGDNARGQLGLGFSGVQRTPIYPGIPLP